MSKIQNKVYSYGILGCGMMGQEHINNLKLFPEINITAICEPDRQMADKAQQIAATAKIYRDVVDFLSNEHFDAIVIASPNYLHLEHFLAVKQYQPVALLIEKPIAINLDQITRWQKEVKNYPAPIWVGMEYRYMPPITKLIELATPEFIGDIAMLSITEHRFPFLPKVDHWNRFNQYTGGTLVEKCCHFFDLMRHIMKADPVYISAVSSQFHNHRDETYPEGAVDIWDHGYVLLQFPQAKKALLELCMFAEGEHYQEKISLIGTKGKLECLVPGPVRFWDSSLGEPPVPKVIISPRNRKGHKVIEVPVEKTMLHAGDHNGATYYQHALFLKVIQGNDKVAVNVADGLKANLIGLEAQQAAVENRVVECNQFIS